MIYSHDMLLERTLRIGELNKYPYRKVLFLDKYRKGLEFEKLNGDTVILKYDKKVERAIQSDDLLKLRKIGIYTIEGDRISLSQLRKTQEFGGGGGAIKTARVELLQVIYLECKWNNPSTNYTLNELQQIINLHNYEIDIDSVSDNWKDSSILISELLYKSLKRKKYTFHFNDSFTQKIEMLFNKFDANIFKNINKWNPSDIWLVNDSNLSRYDLDNVKSLFHLNSILLEAFSNRDIIGVSLKKVVNKVKSIRQVNYRESSKSQFKFSKKSYGKSGFFKTKDCKLYYNDGVIQFRTFPSFQGEIIGKNARLGKIGFSVINDTLIKMNLTPLFNKNHLKKLIKNDYQYFLIMLHEQYLKIGYKSKSFDYFKRRLTSKRTIDWLISKYLSVTLLNTIHGRETEFINHIIKYAKSETPLSSVHLQIK